MNSKAAVYEREVKRPSPSLLRLFRIYLRWYLGRHFHALRLAHAARFPRAVMGPLIICINHPSWWDPLTCLLLSRALMPDADHYAPMEEASLKHYAIMHKLGLFPVEQGTARGAAQFLRSAQRVLTAQSSVLWLTPQGAFTDARTPVVFKGGLGALFERLPAITVMPIAIEYVFWNERLPEILVNCGLPLQIASATSAAGTERTIAALEDAQRELAELAMAREGSRFETIAAGGSGPSGIYELWQRLQARFRGQKYRPEHGSIGRGH